MPDKLRRWFALHPNWTLTFLVLAVSIPFLNKPFNMDDPLFVWTAQYIRHHPGNPYGFDVNWYGAAMPVWLVTKNPPLAGYYLALAGIVFGWSEIAMHFALLFPALAVVLGTHRLARRFCNHPMLAACVTLFTPVFLLSSSTVMCDMLMLAFWVWAVELWMNGLERNCVSRLALSGLLIALAVVTKYFGACLIPLLATYALLRQRRAGLWSLCLLIPIVTLAAYQWWTAAVYGHNLLSGATSYAVGQKGISLTWAATQLSIGLAFTGGCLAVAVFFAPVLWSVRNLFKFGGGAALMVTVYLWRSEALKNSGPPEGIWRAMMEVQIAFWATGGVCLLALAGTDALNRRDSKSALLVLWVVGTFLFAACVNWIVNGRSILPMAPAVGILLARRWEQILQTNTGNFRFRERPRNVAFAVGAVLALLAARSDFLLAKAARAGAEQVCAKYKPQARTLWFQGHWGFQFYMAKFGATPLDVTQPAAKPGDVLAIPFNNTNIDPPENLNLARREILAIAGPRGLTPTSQDLGAGFYASLWGPLPFAFGRVPPENVYIYDLKPPKPTAAKN